MSIIVYGPQGCGKTLNAQRLRHHFKLDRVLDEGDEVTPFNVYDQRHWPRLKAMNALVLTCQEPPAGWHDSRRCISFVDAMRQLSTNGN